MALRRSVEQRELTQWFFKISDYSEDLLKALDTLDRWPDKVRLMQKNWIGRSEGLLLRFPLDPATTPNKETELEIFTTRPDTLFGAKFMALSPDHPLATAAAAKNPKLAAFIEQCHRMGTAQAEIDTAEKLGFDTGMKAVHPFDANWKLPVYVANFILMDYGTGAHFRLPCARSARPGLRQQIRPRQHAGGLPAESGPEDLRHHRRRL